MATQVDEVPRSTESRKVMKEEAPFILGRDGKTKAKLCAVSGAQIELTEGKGDGKGDKGKGAGKGDKGKGATSATSELQISGTARQRRYAQKYIDFVIKQRLGPVKIDRPAEHDDLTILVVPAETVSFITGKQGCFLRFVEDEWKTLLFFLEVNPKNPIPRVNPKKTERLAIFGPQRQRRGAELKVMAAVEAKVPGYFTKDATDKTSLDAGFATDTMSIKDDDYSYALGRAGATRKKLARASGCIVEYVNRMAYFCGTKVERVKAKEYLQWLLQQRLGETVHVDQQGRDDVTVIMVPSPVIGYVTGHKGASLRSIEDDTSTFCFIEGTADDDEDMKPLLIFGDCDDRKIAESMVWEKISHKLDGAGQETYGQGGPRRGKGKGKGKDSKGKDKDKHSNGKTESFQQVVSPGATSEFLEVTDEEAAFLMGSGGRTKKKLSIVSGAVLDFKANRLEILGIDDEREKAKKYINLVKAQRLGPVTFHDSDAGDDATIMKVPADTVSFVTGTQGKFLRMIEEDFGTLLFFSDFNMWQRRDRPERLVILGPLRSRRGAELKVMATVESKHPGHFTKRDEKLPLTDTADGFATDRMFITEEDYSYALGKGGATRRKIARASGCIIEYIGRVAYLAGTKQERQRAREYLTWLFQQRIGAVEVDCVGRSDVTVLQVPKDCVGFVTGYKGGSLRSVEESTGTFCFIEGGREDPQRDPKPLLIFGALEARNEAEVKLQQKIQQKLAEGWVYEETDGVNGHGDAGGGDKSQYKSSWTKPPLEQTVETSNGRSSPSAAVNGSRPAQPNESITSTANGSSQAVVDGSSDGPLSSPTEDATQEAQLAQDDGGDSDGDADGAWGNWGSDGEGGDDEVEETPQSSPPKTASNSKPASPTKPKSAEQVDLPPQLLHEEAWPELGDRPKRR